MWWYVTFCKRRVVQLLKKLDTHIFILVQEELFKVVVKVKNELKILFQGCVFVEADLPGYEFIKRKRSVVYSKFHY